MFDRATVQAVIRRPLPRRPSFHPSSVYVRFVVDQVAMVQVFLRVLWLPLSVKFQQDFILIFNYILLLPEGQTGEDWELSKKQGFFRNRTAVVKKLLSLFPAYTRLVKHL